MLARSPDSPQAQRRRLTRQGYVQPWGRVVASARYPDNEIGLGLFLLLCSSVLGAGAWLAYLGGIAYSGWYILIAAENIERQPGKHFLWFIARLRRFFAVLGILLHRPACSRSKGEACEPSVAIDSVFVIRLCHREELTSP